MPTTITASDGTAYHLFQLAIDSYQEPEDTKSFLTLDNDLGDGYKTSSLFGSNTGTRSWKLKFPTLGHLEVLPNTVTGITGAAVSREQYIRELFDENKITGQPFAFQDPNNNQYYLVDFAESDLSMQRLKVKLYSTGLTMKQRRLPGISVFDVSKMATTAYGYDWFSETSHGVGAWTNKLGGGQSLSATGDVVFSSNNQNGLPTVRLSGSASTGRLNSAAFSAPIFELYIVMKMREATFSNAAGVFTGSSDTPTLVGTASDTKFQNLLGAGSKYFLNGVEYGLTDMQAPMNEFGIVHIQNFGIGWDPGVTVQFGKNQGTAATFAKMDVAEIISFAQRVPKNDSRELIEHLVRKWSIT